MVTDRNMGIAITLHMSWWCFIRKSMFQQYKVYLQEKFYVIFVPNFVTCLRWSYSRTPHGQGIRGEFNKSVAWAWSHIFKFLQWCSMMILSLLGWFAEFWHFLQKYEYIVALWKCIFLTFENLSKKNVPNELL